MGNLSDEEKAEKKAGPVPWYKDWTFWIVGCILAPLLITPAIIAKEVYNKEYLHQFIVWCGRIRWMMKTPAEPMLKVVHEYDQRNIAAMIERLCKKSVSKSKAPAREEIEEEVKAALSYLRDVKPMDHKLYLL